MSKNKIGPHKDPADLSRKVTGRTGSLLWPGKPVGLREIDKAAKHDTSFCARLEASNDVWSAFIDARYGYMSARPVPWGASLITARQGSKMILATLAARDLFVKGCAVFSNMPLMFGWRVESSGLPGALSEIPRGSALFVDASDVDLSGRPGSEPNIDQFHMLASVSRIRELEIIFVCSMEQDIDRFLRLECKRVYSMFLGVHDAEICVMCEVWDDYPYRRGTLMKPVHKPVHLLVADEKQLRQAQLLNGAEIRPKKNYSMSPVPPRRMFVMDELLAKAVATRKANRG